LSEHPEVETVARLLELAARYGLEELEVEEAGLKVSLTAQPPMEEEGGRTYLWTPPVWPEPETPASTRPETARPVLAPLTGTFYRSESPDAAPFAEVGGTVEEGQTLGLIEAMKVFSKVESEITGTVVEIAARNGQLVNHGDVLMYVDPAPAG
jgi:acetyl-CoA carboxylase biotin carboxyl carrier protein